MTSSSTAEHFAWANDDGFGLLLLSSAIATEPMVEQRPNERDQQRAPSPDPETTAKEEQVNGEAGGAKVPQPGGERPASKVVSNAKLS